MPDPSKQKQVGRLRRHRRVRKRVTGTAERPRLAVFRSNKHISAQVIDDVGGRTFRARWEKENLEFQPPVMLTAWLDLLLSGLSDAAGADADLRRAVLRSGWALR